MSSTSVFSLSVKTTALCFVRSLVGAAGTFTMWKKSKTDFDEPDDTIAPWNVFQGILLFLGILHAIGAYISLLALVAASQRITGPIKFLVAALSSTVWLTFLTGLNVLSICTITSLFADTLLPRLPVIVWHFESYATYFLDLATCLIVDLPLCSLLVFIIHHIDSGNTLCNF